MDELIQHRDLVSTRAPDCTTTEKHSHQEHETSYVYFRELAVNARKSWQERGIAGVSTGMRHGVLQWDPRSRKWEIDPKVRWG